jgi:hypothetical protein
MVRACDAAGVAMRRMLCVYGENTTQRRFRPETAVFSLVGTAVSRGWAAQERGKKGAMIYSALPHDDVLAAVGKIALRHALLDDSLTARVKALLARMVRPGGPLPPDAEE